MTPILSGTVADQTTSGASIQPFASANTSDGNPGPDYVTDTLTISLLGTGGNPTDAGGTLTMGTQTGNTTFVEESSGVYQLTVTNPDPDTTTNVNTINAQLHNLTFTPSGAATTTFSVLDSTIYAGHESTNDQTSVVASGGGSGNDATPPATDPTPAAATATATPDTSASAPVASTSDPASPPSDAAAATPATSSSDDSPLVVNNMTKNHSHDSNMTTYNGPVAGLTSEYIYAGSDNMNMVAHGPNCFLHSGSGDDAMSVTSGTNVMDGGSGSNFMTGGSGFDTFFVDDRHAASDTWSTMANFHSGDNATVWGVTSDDFKMSWFDNGGAPGHTGLTMHATSDNTPTASLTLPGYTGGDLSNGKLGVSFGNCGGSNYMMIHAN